MTREYQQVRKLTPEYLAGFIDGVGCFSVSIYPQPNTKWEWVIDPNFTINQQSLEFLESIREFFGCGKIQSISMSNAFVVYDRRAIFEKVIPFIDSYPLISNKRHDYYKFREVVIRLIDKEHLTLNGFHKIVKVAFSMEEKRNYKLEVVLASSSETARQAS